jgi:hypothetical protein
MRDGAFFLAAAAMASAACSTFAVYDAYVTDADGSRSVAFRQNQNVAGMQFLPDGKWSSVGLLGVPAVPVYASRSPPRELMLEVTLMLVEKRRFHFAAPCLLLPDDEICPYIAHVKVQMQHASWQFSGERNHGSDRWVANFPEGPVEIALPVPVEHSRIDDQMIYERFGYQVIPDWNFALVQLVYRYHCSSVCPAEFSLNTDDAVVAEGSVHSAGYHTFHRRRIRQYDPFIPLQD